MDRLALIVEDDMGLRSIYRRVLNDIGYTVLEAADGAVALDFLREHAPNVIFLDILLPHVNGLAVLDFVKQTPHLQDTHIVIVSSNRQFEQYVNQMRSVDFVLKPIRPAQIRDLASGSAV